MLIDKLRIQNFKSIKDSGYISIEPINILIGANGAGKSNFISFFRLLNSISKKRLVYFLADNGYENNLLHFGRKKSSFLESSIVLKSKTESKQYRYDFRLVAKKQSTGLYFERDEAGASSTEDHLEDFWSLDNLGGIGKEESGIAESETEEARHLKKSFEDLKVFHFRDTSAASALKQPNKTLDYKYLKPDGSNLAAFLYKIKETDPKHFKIIEYTINSVAPFFEKFDLAPDHKNPDVIFLNWFEKGSDEYFNAHHLSDGTLRFIALAVLLLQPVLPDTIILDEPELGLHPFAIAKLAALIKKASVHAQIIVATQSVNLINEFSADDIIVTERNNGQTIFSRQSEESLREWLGEYSLGELWEKNVIGGRL